MRRGEETRGTRVREKEKREEKERETAVGKMQKYGGG